MKRDSFIFYRSFMECLACFDDQTRLTVYDAITEYALNGSEPELKGGALGIFKLIKPQIDANNRRFENGHKGGRPKSQTETETKPKENQTKTKDEPNVNVNVNENVNKDINIVGKPDIMSDVIAVVDYLNQKTQSNFKAKTEATKKSIIARLKEGYTVEDFKRVIDAKVKDWSDDPDMREYLRPQTLFRPSNFESYLNEANRPVVKSKNSFRNFDQREYTEDELEKLISN